MKIPKSKLSKNSLKERAIVVTGAGSGIGRALSFELAKNNADLILLSRDQIKLDSLLNMIEKEKKIFNSKIPIVVKVSPDIKDKEISQIAEVLLSN